MPTAEIPADPLDAILTKDHRFRAELEKLRRYAVSKSPIDINGETGTGKELAARAVHELSPRRACPFAAINVAAVPEDVFESELFGHVKGAYTGADSSTEGLLGAYARTTVFLDEIEALGEHLQAKLLRVIENRTYRPVGSPEEREFRGVFVVASNCDLRRLVDLGCFREDLYFRIRSLSIRLPPLRERACDIVYLFDHFLRAYRGEYRNDPVSCEAGVYELLAAHLWPGNVRELKGVAEDAVLTAVHGVIRADWTRDRLSRDARPAPECLDDVRLVQIDNALAGACGNRTRAAMALGLTRNGLRKMIDRIPHLRTRWGGAARAANQVCGGANLVCGTNPGMEAPIAPASDPQFARPASSGPAEPSSQHP